MPEQEYIARRLTYRDRDGDSVSVADTDLHGQDLPLVILGDPGMGKTVLLRRLAERPGYHFMSAAAFLRRPMASSPSEILVLDALDEVAARTDNDPLDQVLEKLGEQQRTQFILSCRAAEWRSSIYAEAIVGDLGKPVRIVSLEPLSDREARVLLRRELGDKVAAEFHDALADHGLASLLTNPQTLSMLREIAHQGIPAGKADLFERAAGRMVAEHNPHHVQSALNALDVDLVLDGAGAAMAVLLLCGKEGIFTGLQALTPPHLQVLASIAALPLAVHANVAIRSRLFRVTGEDSFADCHRTVAEFLAARWIGRVISRAQAPGRMVRRLLSFVRARDGIPASLRGLHAWLAPLSSDCAKATIEADPYGVIRYGDTTGISLDAARSMWASLARHSREDPWFRGGDWQRFSAAGLTQQGMGETLNALLLSPDSGFHLSSLILDLLPGSTCVPEMRAVLLAVMRDPSRAYSERHDAAGALLAWRESGLDWPWELLNIARSGERDDARLADESMAMAGLDRFSDAEIAEIVYAQCGGFAPERIKRRRRPRATDFMSLTYAVPMARCAGILDALASRFAGGETLGMQEEQPGGFNLLIRTLILRQLPGGTPDPILLWRWLETLSRPDWGDQRLRVQLAAWLGGNAMLRQAIQAHIFLTDEGACSRKRGQWHLGGLSAGLAFQEEDVWILLEGLIKRDCRDAHAVRIFEILVVHCRHDEVWSPRIAAAAERYGATDPALGAILHPPPPPVDEALRRMVAEMEADRAAHRRERARRQAEERSIYLDARDAIRAGAGPIGPLALRYLGEGDGGLRDMPLADRIGQWAGEDVHEDALAGFEAALWRAPLSSLAEVAPRVIRSNDMHDRAWPIMAGLAYRHVMQRGFEEIDETLMIEGLIAHCCRLVITDRHLEGFGAALETYALACSERFERFLRALIEPQFKMDRRYVHGLRYVTHGKLHTELRTRLLLEWLEPLVAACPQERKSIIAALVDAPASFQAQASEQVDRLIRQAAPDWRGEPDTQYWLSLRFLRDFENSRTTLDAYALQNPEFLWQLQKAVGHDRIGNRQFRPLSIAHLDWLFRAGDRHWPDTDRPQGTTSGTQNPWDASEFLQAVLLRIGDDVTPEAMRALDALIQEDASSYRGTVRAARARQRRKVVEASYLPPSFAQLAPAFHEEAPRTARDVKAIVLDAIGQLQARIAGSSTDSFALFYENGHPKAETACRNAFLDLLGPTLPFGIAWAPEEQMPKGKRADAGFRLGPLRVPLEAKLASNRSLWSACEAQLDRLYASTDHMAQGEGIYLAFWFGPFASSAPRSPSGARPSSASDIKAMLEAQLNEDTCKRLSICVLDISPG